ncbi:MAG TPA: dienelactone hydrolase family protein [Rubrobacteraceae bacterium]|nr:dienelactone hydrolase family protein [Rubrobacteraceae bacterium]
MATTQTVSFRGEEDQLQGYLARPEGTGPFPGVVVIHEVFGLNENMRDIARRFADAGYAAFAVDLFTGRSRAVCMARFMGGMLRGTPERFGTGDLKAALGVLAQQSYVDGERIGAIGFCMGGGFAVAWACTDDRLKAIAPFYGANPRPLSAVARSCPVVGSYPEKDFTAKSGRKLDAELARHGIPRDIKVYPEAKHSFFNDRGKSYDPAASEDAWRRTLAFFGEHLG